ncbi:MAG TPA: hypothetical protein VH641_09110 [Streptosporangiaceae bacterium]
MDLSQVADELYGLVPAEFIAVRDERVSQARGAGDRELAGAIAKLRKPTVSAWLVNQLAREATDELARLLELGEALREAQRALDSDKLRELSVRRRSQVGALVQQARRLARARRQTVNAQVERDVAASLEAAVADADAADAIAAGRLTSALYHVGLGGDDADGGVGPEWAVPGHPERRLRAVPDPARQPKRTAPPAGQRRSKETGAGRRRTRELTPAERAEREAEQQAAREAAAAERKAREMAAAERDLQEAEALAADASAALTEAEQQVASARARRKSVQHELEELEQRLVTAQAEDAKAGRELRAAQRSREAATGSLSTAQRRVQRAKARLEKLR